MRTRALNANIWKYYVLRIFAKRLVWPILTIFLVRNELSASEIGIIFAVGTLIGLVFEVPSGAIADRIGRKTSMVIAHAGWAVSMFIFWQSDAFTGFLIANALYFATGSLWTGTHNAFIYETLRELGRADDLKKVVGRSLFLAHVTTGILFVAVPLIAAYSLALPFLLNGFVFALSTVLALTVTETKQIESVAEHEIGRDFFGFKAFFKNPALLATGLTFAFIGGINGILEDFRQVYLDVIHLDIVYFGFIYLGLRLFTGVLGAYEDRIERAIGRTATFLIIPLTSLVTYLGLFFINSYLGLLFIVLDGVQSGLSRPLEQEYLNRFMSSGKRATLLSIFNLVTDLVRAGAVLIGGFVIDRGGIHMGFLLAAAMLVVFVSPLMVWFLKQTRAPTEPVQI